MEKIYPDCETCWRRGTCPDAEEGKFCAMWQSKAPEPAGEDPNEAWRRGEDIDF